MVFKSGPTKQAQKLIFSRKSHSPKHLEQFLVEKVKTPKHLGLKLDKRLNLRNI